MSINKFKNKNRGFVLGIAMIVLTVLLTLSISITIILLRDLKGSNISYDTRVASALADSALMCAESIFKNFKSNSNDRSLFPIDMSEAPNYHFNTSGKFAYVDPTTVGCFDVPIFPASLHAGAAPATGTVSTSNYSSITTITYSTVGSYSQGTKVWSQIKRNDFARSACAEIEMHTTSTGAVLIIGRGKVPCDSTSRVERVVVKRYN
jgi:hypothetical protein